MKIFKGTPQFRFDVRSDRYMLYLPEADQYPGDVHSFAVAVKVGWDGESWHQFRFYSWDMGTCREVVTQAQLDEHYAEIAHHESEDVADAWMDKAFATKHIISEEHIVWKLKDHWEAIVGLGLFDPHINLQEEWDVI